MTFVYITSIITIVWFNFTAMPLTSRGKSLSHKTKQPLFL
jgi:hypothetical protein